MTLPSSQTPTGPSNTQAADDHALIVKAQNGDVEAFTALAKRHQERVYRLALRIMHDPTDAEDILQETFLQVFRKLPDFREESSFSTWIHRIAVNTALMRIRAKRARIQTSSLDAMAADSGRTGEEVGDAITSGAPAGTLPQENLLDASEKREFRERIRQALEELPEIYRVVFLLRDVEELSTEEVSEALGIGVPNVKTRLHRARLLLREKLTAGATS